MRIAIQIPTDDRSLVAIFVGFLSLFLNIFLELENKVLPVASKRSVAHLGLGLGLGLRLG